MPLDGCVERQIGRAFRQRHIAARDMENPACRIEGREDHALADRKAEIDRIAEGNITGCNLAIAGLQKRLSRISRENRENRAKRGAKAHIARTVERIDGNGNQPIGLACYGEVCFF